MMPIMKPVRSRQPRTGRLLARAGSTLRVRLTAEDRAVLADLSKVGVIAADDAAAHYYQGRATGPLRRFDRLARAGILRAHVAHAPDGTTTRVYGWGSDGVAKAHGARMIKHQATRSLYHEVLVSKVYFRQGRPDSWSLIGDANKKELRALPGFGASDEVLPDAIFRSADGSQVMVEADSGHYSSTQIKEKMAAWGGCRQIWIQPSISHARVPAGKHIQRITV